MSDPKKPAGAKRVAVTMADEQPVATDEAAKPLIVSRPILKEPQTAPLLQDTAAKTMADGLSNGTASLKAGGKPALKPLTPPAITVKPEDQPASAGDETVEKTLGSDSAAELAAKAAAEAPVVATPSAPAVAAAEPAAPTAPGETDPTEGDDDQKSAPTEEELNAEAEALAKHDEAIQQLVDSKQYFLPINAVEKRKTRHFVILGVLLSVLLLLAWGDIALDAGLIQISGIKPATHFFSN
jgi:hypothetical protein